MTKFHIDPFYGQETINNQHLRDQNLPLGVNKDIFHMANPKAMHPHADKFFKGIALKPPTRFELIFKSKKTTSYLRNGQDTIDLRRMIVAMDRSGYSAYYKCRKGFSERGTDLVYVVASKYYKSKQLKYMLMLPESLGMPEPTLIQTRGDSIIRYYYFLKYTSNWSQQIKDLNLQTQLNILWAGAEVDVDPNDDFMLPGFSNYRTSATSSGKVRTVGGCGDKIEASDFYASIQCIARNNADKIFYSFKHRKPNTATSLDEKHIHSLSKLILQTFTPTTPLGRRHYFVSYVLALIDVGFSSVNHEEIARSLPFQVDHQSCPGYLFPAPEGVTSSYFWNLASLINCKTFTMQPFDKRISDGLATTEETVKPRTSTQRSLRNGKDIVQNAISDLHILKDKAREITSQNQHLYVAEQLQILKSFSKTLDIKFDTSYIEGVFNQALMYANGSQDPLTPNDQLNFDSVPWLWESIIIDKAANLLVAQPKTGKTTLVLAFISALLKGEDSFLGKTLQPFNGKVVIVGTDQPESDWARMLEAVGLLDANCQMHSSIIRLYTAGRPLYLDERGLEELEVAAREVQRLLIVLDSFAACTSLLGIDENHPRAGQIIQQFVSRMATFGATVLIIHHSGKGLGTESPTTRSRGSTAIPAAVSQIISLSRFTAKENDDEAIDNRLILETEGRAGCPTRMFIQRTDAGWLDLGDGKRLKQEQNRNIALEKLNNRQKKCLQVVEELWRNHRKKVSASELAEALPMEFNGMDSERSARSVLSQLMDRGLIKQEFGKPILWFPVGIKEPNKRDKPTST